MSRLPSSDSAKRIAVLFRRRLTTKWDPKEIKRFRELVKDGCFESLDDLALIERYYMAERKRGPDGHHRRDLLTFLNNYRGEVDKANEWANAIRL